MTDREFEAPTFGEHYISVNLSITGYFVCEMWINPEMGGFAEPWESHPMRFKTYAAAAVVGRQLAADLELTFVDGEEQGDLVETGYVLGEYFEGKGFESIEIGGNEDATD